MHVYKAALHGGQQVRNSTYTYSAQVEMGIKLNHAYCTYRTKVLSKQKRNTVDRTHPTVMDVSLWPSFDTNVDDSTH